MKVKIPNEINIPESYFLIRSFSVLLYQIKTGLPIGKRF